LSGLWTGPFEDSFEWSDSPNGTTEASCRGTLEVWFNPSEDEFTGVLGQDQDCRFGQGEWFQEVSDGWLIDDIAIVTP